MNEKKIVLVKILNKLKKNWDQAQWFLSLLESKYCDEKTVNEITRMIFDSLKKTKEQMDDIKWARILEKSMNILKKIHKEEFTDREKEKKEIDKLLEDL